MPWLIAILALIMLWAGPAGAEAPINVNGQWRQDDEGPNLILMAQDHGAVLVIFDGATAQGQRITYYGSGTITGRKIEYNYIFTRSPQGWKNGDMTLFVARDGQSMEGQWVAGWGRGRVIFRRLK